MVQTTHLRLAFASCFMLWAFGSHAQIAFTNANASTGLVAANSGNAVTVVDVNNDGLDDIVKMDQSTTLIVDLQNTNGTFTHYNLGTISSGNVWGMAAADVDHNGWKDIATGANGTMYLVKLFWSGTTITKTVTTLSGSYFVQNITFGDFDNDGWSDLFVCDDNAYGKIYKNNAGVLTVTTALINTAPGSPTMYGSDPADSGNYGSVWTDFDGDGDLDLFVAHCRQASSSNTDLRRKDRLYVNNGSNVYTEQAATYGIEVTDYKQTWTASFGDIDNDGDLDLVVTNHGETGQVFENDGTGHYSLLPLSGFNTVIDPIESVVEDFDNDGYLDILITGTQWYLWHNNGNKTFTQQTGIFANLGGMLSFATGDLNHDGFVDVYASYGNVYNSPGTDPDVLYLNNKNSNHFITFDLTGTTSNHDAIGAKVTIHGSFGTQVREVRAGETYGTANSMQCHFGLGNATSITSATIDWPAGGTTTFGALNADQFVTAVESGCTITGNTIPGPYNLCTGQTLTLNAAAGYSSYNWSSGQTTQSITTSTTGNFNVTVTSGACSNISPTATVVLNPNETPTVTTSGINYCQGVATLTSTPASAYSWSGPGGFSSSAQSINPPQSGNYSVTITGTCANFTSTPVNINVLAAPAPSGTGASGPGPASFTLTASGTGGSLKWYDLPSAGTLLGTGTSYTTPVISSTTTYYVQDAFAYPGAVNFGGQVYHTGASLYSAGATDGSVDFNVTSACTLSTVKVYAQVAGARKIILTNSAGTTIDSSTVTLPIDTSVVTLNFPLNPGTGYSLTTDASVNTANFGTTNPKLQRSSTGVSYPYNIGGMVSLTGSNQGSPYYYYFYNWKVTGATSNCISARTPVTATITGPTGITSLSAGNGVKIYPNPASSEVNVEFNATMDGKTTIEMTDITGRIVRTVSVEKAIEGQVVQLNVSDMSAGTYLINIKTDSKHLIQKLMLTK